MSLVAVSRRVARRAEAAGRDVVFRPVLTARRDGIHMLHACGLVSGRREAA